VDGTTGRRRELPVFVFSGDQLVTWDFEPGFRGWVHQTAMVVPKERYYR
jgi:hypothetical protein